MDVTAANAVTTKPAQPATNLANQATVVWGTSVFVGPKPYGNISITRDFGALAAQGIARSFGIVTGTVVRVGETLVSPACDLTTSTGAMYMAVTTVAAKVAIPALETVA